MADLTPNNREEYWLQGMVDGQTTLEPNKRREYWYKEIVDAIGSGGGGGTGGGALVVHEDENGTLDKTWQEIHDAVASGKIVVIPYIADGVAESQIVAACNAGEPFRVSLLGSQNQYVCASATDYPTYDES